MGDFSLKIVEDHSIEVKRAKDGAVEKVLEAMGIFVEGAAKNELEHDPRRIDTGRLRNSIAHETKTSEDAVYIGTNVEYAPYVHEGTVKMKPNHFLLNAIQNNKDQLENYARKELENA